MKTVRHIRYQAHISGQALAVKEVQKAIASGKLPKPSSFLCYDCEIKAQVYDHRDYNKPLDVVPVCRSCNAKRGAAIPLENPEDFMIEKNIAIDEQPSFICMSIVCACKTYREAVNTAWAMRKNQRMTKATLSEITGIFPAHVTDFINDTLHTPKGVERRDMPAKYIPLFEQAVGNTFVSQWLAQQCGLTVLESLLAERKAA